MKKETRVAGRSSLRGPKGKPSPIPQNLEEKKPYSQDSYRLRHRQIGRSPHRAHSGGAPALGFEVRGRVVVFPKIPRLRELPGSNLPAEEGV